EHTDMDSESKANYEIFSLEIGDTFTNWDLAASHIEKHRIENGFETVKTQLQKNKKEEIVRRTFECKHSHEYHAKKKADTEDNRDCESYSEAWKYLECVLGVDITGWVLCYTHKSFNDTQIQLQFNKEEQFEREEQTNQNPT
ncbi:30349_t:CDS:2, partial [Racocetra persica]